MAIANNPSGWNFIVGLCLNEAEHGRKFGMQFAIEQARRKAFVSLDGADFKINNTFAPYFGRILLEEHPEAGEFLRIRHAKVDDLGGDR